VDTDTLIQEATKLYKRLCDDSGVIFEHPAPMCCRVDGDVVTLANAYRVLARYRVFPDGEFFIMADDDSTGEESGKDAGG
jgi:hypothetical protein